MQIYFIFNMRIIQNIVISNIFLDIFKTNLQIEFKYANYDLDIYIISSLESRSK